MKELAGTGIHESFETMVGYVMKDRKEYAGWTYRASDSITDEIFLLGDTAYQQYGAPDKGNVVSITRGNLLDRAFAFYKVAQRRGGLVRSDDEHLFVNVVHSMILSGQYRPSADWVIPRFGNGASLARSDIAFRLITQPSSATVSDIRAVHVL